MLVLSRKLNQTICIGEDIFVTVSQIKSRQIRLAIQAPANVNVRRSEIEPRSKLPVAAEPQEKDLTIV